VTFPFASSYAGLARRQSGLVHIGLENHVEILWGGGEMLRFPTGELNLAPRAYLTPWPPLHNRGEGEPMTVGRSPSPQCGEGVRG